MSLLVVLISLLHVINCEMFDPTITNSTGSFYVASVQSYQDGVITCTTSYCHILCDISNGCNSLKVYTSSSLTTLVVQCLQYYACYRAYIYADHSNAVALYCNYASSYSACGYLTLYASNVSAVSIYCGYNDCTSSYFYLQTAKSVNITCDGCKSARFTVRTYNSELNLNCATSTSCDSAYFFCEDTSLSSQLIYSSPTGWTCDDYACCPVLATVTCSSGVSCQIDCDTQNCTNYRIDATLATSLILNCGSSGCSARIECPMEASASCDILCPEAYTCEYAYIQTSTHNMDSLGVICGGWYSCQYMVIALESSRIETLLIDCTEAYSCTGLSVTATSAIHDFNMDCTAEGACTSVIIDLISTESDTNVYITCANPSVSTSSTFAACYNANFQIYGYNNYGIKTNNMSISCGAYDCYYVEMTGLDLNQFDANCSGSNSCYQASIHAEASNQFNLDCGNEGSCYSSSIYCPYHREQACDIDCAAYTDSCSDMDIYVPTNYVYNYLDIICPSKLLYADTLNPCDNIYIRCSDEIFPYYYAFVRLSFDYSGNEWNCGAYSSFCCPYLNTKTTAVQTTKNQTTTVQTTTKTETTVFLTTLTEPEFSSTANQEQIITDSSTKQPMFASTANQEPIITNSSTKQPSFASTANQEQIITVPSTDSDEFDMGGELQNDDGNNSDTVAIIIVVFSSVLFLLMIIIIAGIFFHLKTLNNKIQQNSIGIELIGANKHQMQNNTEIETNTIGDNLKQVQIQLKQVQEGNDDIVEQINQTARAQ